VRNSQCSEPSYHTPVLVWTPEGILEEAARLGIECEMMTGDPAEVILYRFEVHVGKKIKGFTCHGTTEAVALLRGFSMCLFVHGEAR